MFARPELDDVGTLLLRAADELNRRNHYRGPNSLEVKGDNNICMLMAINLAAGSHGKTSQAADRVRSYIGTSQLSDWNDSHSKSECVAALREAAYNTR